MPLMDPLIVVVRWFKSITFELAPKTSFSMFLSAFAMQQKSNSTIPRNPTQATSYVHICVISSFG